MTLSSLGINHICTWAGVEIIQFFLRNGSYVYVCDLDTSKAFDRVKHSVLYKNYWKVTCQIYSSDFSYTCTGNKQLKCSVTSSNSMNFCWKVRCSAILFTVLPLCKLSLRNSLDGTSMDIWWMAITLQSWGTQMTYCCWRLQLCQPWRIFWRCVKRLSRSTIFILVQTKIQQKKM